MQQRPGTGVKVISLAELSSSSGWVELLEGCAVLEVAGGAAALDTLRGEGRWVELDGPDARVSLNPLPPLLVLTELEPPEPMRRILERLAAMAPGEVLLALLPHVPVPLFPHLDARGAAWDVARRADGRGLLWVRAGAR